MRLTCLFLIAALSAGCEATQEAETLSDITTAEPGGIVEVDGGASTPVDAGFDSSAAVDTSQGSAPDAGSAADAGTGAPAVIYDQCYTPGVEDLLYPPYPPIPQDCVQDFWECPYEPGYGTVNPTTVCNITEGYDSDGAIQAQFWEAYNFARDYFGAYGPVYVYFMGPTSEESNQLIWELRAQRRAVPEACYPVKQQVDSFSNNEHGNQELAAANSGEGGFFSISGNGGCNPLMDLMMINPMLDEVRAITMHEYTHVFQASHILSEDRDSDYGLNSWIMEGQATYLAAKFGEETGWGPGFEFLMMGMKHWGGNVSPQGIDAFLAEESAFQLDDESYWEQNDLSAPAVYYQLGAWAWAYLIHQVGGDYDIALKDFIKDVPVMGRAASFEKHFDRTMEDFFEEFSVFVQGSDDDWKVILD
jgi:hypothetical protein